MDNKQLLLFASLMIRSTPELTKELIEKLPPEHIRAEAFLENLCPFVPSSKKSRKDLLKEKILRGAIGPDGEKRDIKIVISGVPDLGLPNTVDFDFFRAFLKICDDIFEKEGLLKPPITVPSKRLAKIADKPWNKKTRKEISDWLDKMTGTYIRNWIYRAEQKSYIPKKTGTHIFDRYVTRGELLEESGEIAETTYIYPASWFIENYNLWHVRRFDLTLHNRLRKPIAKSLYPLLETGFYASNGKSYAKKYPELCREFLLTEYHKLSRIKQQLDPSHQDLQEEYYLKEWDYQKPGNDFTIVYYPGKKYLEDQKAREQRKQVANHLRLQKTLPSPDNSQYLLADILEVCGDRQNQGAYFKLIQAYPEGLIRMALAETRQADREGRIRKSKGAYFTDTPKRLAPPG